MAAAPLPIFSSVLNFGLETFASLRFCTKSFPTSCNYCSPTIPLNFDATFSYDSPSLEATTSLGLWRHRSMSIEALEVFNMPLLVVVVLLFERGGAVRHGHGLCRNNRSIDLHWDIFISYDHALQMLHLRRDARSTNPTIALFSLLLALYIEIQALVCHSRFNLVDRRESVIAMRELPFLQLL